MSKVIRKCYECGGISREEHDRNTAMMFFTQDMHKCESCGKLVTSSMVSRKLVKDYELALKGEIENKRTKEIKGPFSQFGVVEFLMAHNPQEGEVVEQDSLEDGEGEKLNNKIENMNKG